MKVACLIALAFVAVASANPTADEWTLFKSSHGKQYDSPAEEMYRRMVYEANVKYIEAHNQEADAGLHTYRLGVNAYADMTNDEFNSVMLGVKQDMNQRISMNQVDEKLKQVKDLPAAVDWRDKGYVTPVKDQGQCGSCWSFSATGSIEGQHFKATGKLVSLSEQNLMDCSVPEGNQGCDGGLMDQAFDYVIKNKGVDTEAFYPYEAQDGRCRFSKTHIGATISSYKDIPQGDEMSLTAAIASVGPISVAIDASQNSFQLYDGGVYDEPACSSTQLDHGVLAVGYDSQGSKDYYIVKNSWGASWGLNG